MNKRRLLMMLFGITLTMSLNAYAEWQGPKEIVAAEWGNGNNQVGLEHGDTGDIFPAFFDVSNDGHIVIADALNGRFKLYTRDGQLLMNTAPLVMTRPIFVGSSIILIAKSVSFYSFDGKLIKSIDIQDKTIDHWLVEDDKLIIRTKIPIRWEFYSSSGERMKTTTEEPMNFGVVEQYRINQIYKSTVIFPDTKYQITSPQPLNRYYRGPNKYLYQIETYVAKGNRHKGVSYRIHKYNLKSEKIAELTLPVSKYERRANWFEDAPTWVQVPVVEYGLPIVVPNGDVYCSARTKTHFKILKWAWVESPTGHNQSEQNMK